MDELLEDKAWSLVPWELSGANVCLEPEFMGAHWKLGAMGASWCQGG